MGRSDCYEGGEGEGKRGEGEGRRGWEERRGERKRGKEGRRGRQKRGGEGEGGGKERRGKGKGGAEERRGRKRRERSWRDRECMGEEKGKRGVGNGKRGQGKKGATEKERGRKGSRSVEMGTSQNGREMVCIAYFRMQEKERGRRSMIIFSSSPCIHDTASDIWPYYKCCS